MRIRRLLLVILSVTGLGACEKKSASQSESLQEAFEQIQVSWEEKSSIPGEPTTTLSGSVTVTVTEKPSEPLGDEKPADLEDLSVSAQRLQKLEQAVQDQQAEANFQKLGTDDFDKKVQALKRHLEANAPSSSEGSAGVPPMEQAAPPP